VYLFAALLRWSSQLSTDETFELDPMMEKDIEALRRRVLNPDDDVQVLYVGIACASQSNQHPAL
jgi:hypothetical protein